MPRKTELSVQIGRERDINALRFFGGAPKEMLYDNLKSVVKDRDDAGRPIFNARFEDFAAYYGF